jgi:hypothetical protein
MVLLLYQQGNSQTNFSRLPLLHHPSLDFRIRLLLRQLQDAGDVFERRRQSAHPRRRLGAEPILGGRQRQ